MLKFLRKKTKVIVWTVVIAFIAWGGYAVSVQFEESNRSAGQIFGKEVSFRDYELAHRAVLIFISSPDEKTPPSAEEVEARTWQFLALSKEAKHQKIAVADDEIRQEIFRSLGEKAGAGFTPEQYERWVRASFREEPPEFENQVREQLRIRKLLDEVRKGFKEKPEENLQKWLNELITRAHIRVPKTRS